VSDRALDSLAYDELVRLAHQARRPYAAFDTLNTTALAHEAYLKLAGHRAGRGLAPAHLRALVARILRQVLVDRARRRYAGKHGAPALAQPDVSADTLTLAGVEQPLDLLEVDQLLRQLSDLDARQADVVEQHVFGGMSFAEIAALSGVTERTVYRDWRKARAFLLAKVTV
jgi:RNA polymerase sigma factor (TIGR02999 family)